MKRLFLSAFVLSCFFQAQVYAQKSAVEKTKSDYSLAAETVIRGMLDQMKTNIKHPLMVNKLIHELDSTWDGYIHQKVSLSPELRREATMRLVEIFNSIDSVETNYANKVRIVEFVGKHDNSSEAHQFFLKQLDTENPEFLEYTLRSIVGGGGIEGDDLYNKIKELVAKGKLREGASLRYLKAANKQRAVKEFQDFLAKTNDLDEYITAGIFLCDYTDPTLIDVLVDRYPDFENKPRKSFGDNPAFAFGNVMLRKYIEVSDGERLLKALKILRGEDISGNRDLPLLEKKLKTGTPTTRKAILEFMLSRTKPGYASKDKVLNILRDAAVHETDRDVKGKIADGIKALEQRK